MKGTPELLQQERILAPDAGAQLVEAAVQQRKLAVDAAGEALELHAHIVHQRCCLSLDLLL